MCRSYLELIPISEYKTDIGVACLLSVILVMFLLPLFSRLLLSKKYLHHNFLTSLVLEYEPIITKIEKDTE